MRRLVVRRAGRVCRHVPAPPSPFDHRPQWDGRGQPGVGRADAKGRHTAEPSIRHGGMLSEADPQQPAAARSWVDAMAIGLPWTSRTTTFEIKPKGLFSGVWRMGGAPVCIKRGAMIAGGSGKYQASLRPLKIIILIEYGHNLFIFTMQLNIKYGTG